MLQGAVAAIHATYTMNQPAPASLGIFALQSPVTHTLTLPGSYKKQHMQRHSLRSCQAMFLLVTGRTLNPYPHTDLFPVPAPSPDGGDLLHHISRGVQVDEALVDPADMQQRQQESSL